MENCSHFGRKLFPMERMLIESSRKKMLAINFAFFGSTFMMFDDAVAAGFDFIVVSISASDALRSQSLTLT